MTSNVLRAIPQRASRIPIFIGIAGSVLWIGLFAFYFFWKQTQLSTLAPNELGDFLAGTFAPLAFLWLVAGFFQQANELRNQIVELQRQVAATADLARAAISEEFRETRRSEPLFAVQHPSKVSMAMGTEWGFVIKNAGPPLTDLRVDPNSNELAVPAEALACSLLSTGDELFFHLVNPSPGKFAITFLTPLRFRESAVFFFDGETLELQSAREALESETPPKSVREAD